MAKKDFRALSTKAPLYPKPSELTPTSMRKLGLAALGGLLLGGAASAIPRAHAEEAEGAKLVRPEGKRPKGSPAQPKGDATKGKPATPAPPPRPRPNGGKTVPRMLEVDETPKPGAPKAPVPKKGTALDKSIDLFPAKGTVQHVRLPEEEETPTASKGKADGGSVADKKQPEPLPPPGAPPLPHDPPPAPAPKKAK